MSAPIGSARHAALCCTATTATGKPCQVYRASGSKLCRFHQPEAVADRQKARDAHVKAATVHRAEEAIKVQLTTPEEVRALIAETATRLRAGQIPAATAVALDRLARTALSAIEADQLSAATQELAERRAAQPAGHRRR